MIGRLCNYYYLSKFLCLEQSYILQLLLELVGSGLFVWSDTCNAVNGVDI